MLLHDSNDGSPSTNGANNIQTLPKNTLLASKGKAPWYTLDGNVLDAFVIGVAGGSGSGKTTVAQEIVRRIDVPWVIIVSQDSFYKSLTPEESKKAFQNMYNFDTPEAFDFDLLKQCIRDLRQCRSVQIPSYDFSKHARVSSSTYIYGGAVIILEGICILQDPELRNLLDLKVFVQCDADVMLVRRIRRDVQERGRDVSGILDQYIRFVKPSFDDHIKSTSKHADIIVPGSSNNVAIDLITSHIRRELHQRSLHLRPDLTKSSPTIDRTLSMSSIQSQILPSNVNIMDETPQLKGIHTVLRDLETLRGEFIFFADRLATLLIEHVFSNFIYPLSTSPTSSSPSSERLDISPHLCGVSIARSGACLEMGLRRVARDIPLGSLLIQSDLETGEPLLYKVKLPNILKNGNDLQEGTRTTVILMDSQIGTGASAIMAIRVLLDHRIREEDIIFVCFLLSVQGGVHSICRMFPKIRIVSSAADIGLEERFVSSLEPTGVHAKRVWAITPGMGSFGDRYFGTDS